MSYIYPEVKEPCAMKYCIACGSTVIQVLKDGLIKIMFCDGEDCTEIYRVRDYDEDNAVIWVK